MASMLRFSVGQLLLLTTFASFATALLVWHFWFALVCLAQAVGIALGAYGLLKQNTRLRRFAIGLCVGSAGLLAYDFIAVGKWVGSCGFEIEARVVDSQTGVPVSEGHASIVPRLALELGNELSFREFEEIGICGSAGKVSLSVRYGCRGRTSGLGFFNSRSRPPSLADYFLVIEAPGYDRFEQQLSTLFPPGTGVHDPSLPRLKVQLTRVEKPLEP